MRLCPGGPGGTAGRDRSGDTAGQAEPGQTPTRCRTAPVHFTYEKIRDGQVEEEEVVLGAQAGVRHEGQHHQRVARHGDGDEQGHERAQRCRARGGEAAGGGRAVQRPAALHGPSRSLPPPPGALPLPAPPAPASCSGPQHPGVPPRAASEPPGACPSPISASCALSRTLAARELFYSTLEYPFIPPEHP